VYAVCTRSLEADEHGFGENQSAVQNNLEALHLQRCIAARSNGALSTASLRKQIPHSHIISVRLRPNLTVQVLLAE
jgi:hypothetical protein